MYREAKYHRQHQGKAAEVLWNFIAEPAQALLICRPLLGSQTENKRHVRLQR